MNLLQRNIGQLILTAATIDDAFGWLMLSVVSAMATTGVRMTRISLSILSLVAVVTVALTVGRPLVRAVLRATSRSEEAGPTIAAAVMIVLLGAAATHWLGLEAGFGAFVCGILIGSCGGLPRERLAPLRTVVLSVLAPLFFATAGLRMDLTALGNPTVLVATLVMILIAVVGNSRAPFWGPGSAGSTAGRPWRWERA